MNRFSLEGAKHVSATLQDMVQSGVAYCSGTGDATLHGLTNQVDRKRMHLSDSALRASSGIWYLVATATGALNVDRRHQQESGGERGEG